MNYEALNPANGTWHRLYPWTLGMFNGLRYTRYSIAGGRTSIGEQDLALLLQAGRIRAVHAATDMASAKAA